jgi:inorganic pyrophosphatase
LTLVDSLKAGKNPPDEINVVIEIPRGSNIKYEIDDETGAIFVDRKLFTVLSHRQRKRTETRLMSWCWAMTQLSPVP